MDNQNDIVTFSGNLFSYNDAQNGGALSLNGTTSLTNNTFNSNTAQFSGSGVYVQGGGEVCTCHVE